MTQMKWILVARGSFTKSIVAALLWRVHVIVPVLGFTAVPFDRPRQLLLPSSSQKLAAASLTSALESLADDRCTRFPEYQTIEWFDPTDTTTFTTIVSEDDPHLFQEQASIVSLPLYPLSAVYVPCPDVNHTLINIEPRNLQMARDLALLLPKNNNDNGDDTNNNNNNNNNNTSDPLFCVTLTALDTGRLARVGTIMKMIDLNTDNDKRMIVTCVAQSVATIIQVENPSAASWDSRIRKSPEYLVARVAVPLQNNTAQSQQDTTNIIMDPSLANRLVEDYTKVREFYTQPNSIAWNDLPPFATQGNTMQANLPMIAPTNLTTTKGVWKLASLWQALCYTVREGRQIKLSSDRNELLVAAAIRKGGPLQLPAHLEDVSPPDRQAVQTRELQSQHEWLELQLDPCLDFQVLLTTTNNTQRLELLGRWIARERLRLEQLEAMVVLERSKQIRTNNDQSTIAKRQGAWFDDDSWSY